ncbi:hypothetical protein HanIR_Chr14g0707111 [Helianthus annuus]|nr:hypothetical protein HanIR_Chr14g0707111 [Helianthus annuus]
MVTESAPACEAVRILERYCETSFISGRADGSLLRQPSISLTKDMASSGR